MIAFLCTFPHCVLPTVLISRKIFEIFFQVCPQSKILGDVATQNMIKVTAVKPHLRMKKIRENLRERNEAFKKDPYAKAFGISVQDNLSEIDGRVLDAPKIEYQGL